MIKYIRDHQGVRIVVEVILTLLVGGSISMAYAHGMEVGIITLILYFALYFLTGAVFFMQIRYLINNVGYYSPWKNIIMGSVILFDLAIYAVVIMHIEAQEIYATISSLMFFNVLGVIFITFSAMFMENEDLIKNRA